jgi:hypothetical protein
MSDDEMPESWGTPSGHDWRPDPRAPVRHSNPPQHSMICDRCGARTYQVGVRRAPRRLPNVDEKDKDKEALSRSGAARISLKEDERGEI